MTGNVMSTAADYAWLEEHYADLTEAYSLTLVKGLSPEQLLRALRAEVGAPVTGVAALCEATHGVNGAPGSDLLRVGVAAVEGWSLTLACTGCTGITDEIMLPVLRRGTVVSHSRHAHGDDFWWIRKGVVRLEFEPFVPTQREGTHADILLPAMREAGFDLTEDDDERDSSGRTKAAFALAHRITGIAVTARLFASATFACGGVRIPR